jgi:hypothetical protein
MLAWAAGESSHSLTINPTSSHLPVEGLKIVQVTAVVSALPHHPMTGRQRNPDITNREEVLLLQDIAARIGFLYASFRSEKHKAFTRTLCTYIFDERWWPSEGGSVPSAAESEVAVHQILTKDIEEARIWHLDEFEHVLAYIRHSCIGRTFFMTGEGIPGLGPLAAREGDIVAVILGCNSPMMLRPTTEGYMVIGEAYCDGHMHGEALLRPLPDSFEAIWRYDDNMGDPYYRWAYRSRETGLFQVEDPRLGPLPEGWTVKSHEREEFWQMFVNDNSGEETRFDPRLTSEELRKRGVPIQVFDLI